MNCWEHIKCSDKIRTACSAFVNNKGQDCWKINGTNCMSGKDGTDFLAEKFLVCKDCTFYTDILGEI